jgi:hypothetical protein
MYTYKLYLGIPNGRDGIASLIYFLADQGVDGASIYRAVGVWKGEDENSVIVEVVTKSDKSSEMHDVGKRYCKKYKQESYLLTMQPVDMVFVNVT